MNKKRLNLIIFIYCISLCIILVIGLIYKNTGFTGKTLQSALLNEKYKNEINKIKISFPNNYSFVFTKANNNSGNTTDNNLGDYRWICHIETELSFNQFFYADNSTIEKLLDSFCQTRNFIQLSDKFSDWKQFGISDDEAVNISFYESHNGNEIIRSDLFFGRNTTDYSGVYARNGKNAAVYRVDNGISTFLTDDGSFWADLYIFPISGNRSKLDESSFSSISASLLDKNESVTNSVRLYNDGKNEFSSYVHKLLSLRGSALVDARSVESFEAIKVLEISTEYAAKENSEIEVYLTDSISASETRYFVRNKESITSSFSNYFIEISAWTYRNLLPSAVM